MRHSVRWMFVAFASFIVAVEPRPVCAGILGAPGNLGGVAVAFYKLSFAPPTPPVYLPVDIIQAANGEITYTVLFSAGPPPVYISAYGSRDPFIEYTLSATNNSNVDEFVNFFFGIPISPRGDNSVLQTVLHVNLSNNIGDTPSITPTYDEFNASPGIQRALLSSNGGTSFDTEFGPLGGTITSPGSSDFGFFQPATNLPVMTSYDYLGLLDGFILSPGTAVTISGFVGIDSITPEPSTLGLSVVCVVSLILRHGLLRRGRLAVAAGRWTF